MKKTYPTIEIPASGESGMWGGAWCFFFMYTKNNGNYIIKGYMKEIEDYIEKNKKQIGPHIVNKVLFMNGKPRFNHWSFWKEGVSIYSPSPEWVRNDKRWGKYQIKNNVTDKSILLKRMPHKWIPEFDKLCYGL